MTINSTIRNKFDETSEGFLEFENGIRAKYPECTGDIGSFILIELSKYDEGTDEYQVWSLLWNEYCDFLQTKSRLAVIVAKNTRNKVLSHI